MKFNIFKKIFSHNTQQNYASSLKNSKKLAQKFQEYKPSTLSKGQNLAKSLDDQLNTNAELIMSQNQNLSIKQKAQLLEQNFILDKAKHKVDIKNLILKMNDIQYNYYDNTQIPSIPLSPYVRENYLDERILLEKAKGLQDNSDLQDLQSIQSYQNRKFEKKLQKTKQESEMIENGQLNLDEWQAEEKNYSNPAYKLRVLQNIDNFRKTKNSLVEKKGLIAILKQKKLKLPKLTKAKIQDDTFTTSENGNLNITNKNAGLTNIPLHLTQKDFNQLFSSDDKKFQIQQSDIQDCFLVSALESILKNPKARAKYYQCFSKDQDGSFQFTFADNFKVKFPKDKQGNPSTFKTVSSNLKGDLGHQLFEQAYAIKRMNDFCTLVINTHNNNKSLLNSISSFQNQQLKNLQNGNADIDQVFNQLSQIVSRYNLQPDQNQSLLYNAMALNAQNNSFVINNQNSNLDNYQQYVGVSGILFTGTSSEIFSSIFDQTQFIGTQNNILDLDKYGNVKNNISVNYNQHKKHILKSNSDDYLINLHILENAKSTDKMSNEYLFEGNEFKYNHMYSVDTVDVKSQESYLVDPENPENTQLIKNNDLIKDTGFYYRKK